MAIQPPERATQPRRNPDRKKTTASISIRWPVYDQLDAMAEEAGLSLAMVIESLVEQYQKKESG